MNSSNENEMYKKRKQQEHQAATKKNQKTRQNPKQKPKDTKSVVPFPPFIFFGKKSMNLANCVCA